MFLPFPVANLGLPVTQDCKKNLQGAKKCYRNRKKPTGAQKILQGHKKTHRGRGKGYRDAEKLRGMDFFRLCRFVFPAAARLHLVVK
ncbi:MAG TPA: hypothetical protein VFD29_04335 [Gillisia sp.]|nr:hypothetical protein [Gillisia sp.]